MGFKHFLQYDTMDCGPVCLKMVAHHYGKNINLDILREKSKLNKNGVSLFAISEAAESIGFNSSGVIVSFDQLKDEVPLPAIIHWSQNHFVVVYKLTANKIYVADPGQGLKTYTKQEFIRFWSSIQEKDENFGVVLVLEPTSQFYQLGTDVSTEKKSTLAYLLPYFKQYQGELFYVCLAIMLSSAFQFTFPFLTQAIVDKGIEDKSKSLILLILGGQMALLLGRMFIDYIRSWFLLFINSRINISILSDFLNKLMKLPVSYFDTRRTGDILQRISDQQRIQDFLTGAALETIFSVVTVIVLGLTLAVYSPLIFSVFLLFSVLYIVWTIYMLKYNTILNFKRFELGTKNQTQTLQIINGIQDIKLYNSEKAKRWSWEKIQAKLFKLNINYLKYTQVQQSGSFVLNEGKNLLITYISAIYVVDGMFTLGMMLAVQALVGQLNGPISLVMNLIQRWNETKLSLDRLNEINELKDEEDHSFYELNNHQIVAGIHIKNLSFAYPGTDEKVLDDISIEIPLGKTTAIVGASGSGKTTLIKLLTRFYENYEGSFLVGNIPMSKISPKQWRSNCGSVMQESFIFSDSIARNVSLGEDRIDYGKLDNALHTANITEFVQSLPLGYNTNIGAEGLGVSQGQRQRLLIARAVYKDPDFIFLDEATNALDASNESVIVKNLDTFFKNKTVVVVAHRLSTVKNADQIIVLDKGKVVEMGTHEDLINLKEKYYTLIKDQLELGM